MADEAVKTGKVNIQDADDFFAWASNNQSNTSVSYRFYSKKEYTEAVVFLESNYNNIKPVPNTIKLHSVSGVSAEQVMVRETSCYCSNRLKEGGFEASSTCGWKPVTILSEIRGRLDSRLAVDVNDWVAADYDDNWYIGQVQQIDEEHGEIEVSFMTKGKGKAATNSFKWPAQKDVLWVTKASFVSLSLRFLPAKQDAPSKSQKQRWSSLTNVINRTL